MDLIFEDIRERDMDFLFIEELNVNYEFAKELFKNYIKDLENIKKITAKHSLVDSIYGETDIYVEIITENNNNIILLIENKIDALFQPEQSERYNIRKNNLLSENKNIKVYTILFAPEKYIKSHNESKTFDYNITYEKIMEYFENNNSERDKYKSNIVKMAIEQSRRGYVPKEDVRVTDFWRNYWENIYKNYPNIIMKKPDIKPFDADWPLMFLKWLPKKWEIFHKLSRGVIDLQTTLNENEISKYENIDNEISIEKTGKSYSFRLNVPKIDRLMDFNNQINEINRGLEKIKLFDKIKARGNFV